jgi:O-acetyl-ADP-ribose deacetylase (regulator of RNase III)
MKEINFKYGKCKLIKGDITMQKTDAIVNAANKRLAPGGGVAGAIHRAAGPKIWEECRKLGGCKTGEAKLTKGHNLKAKYVIHTVGPIWHGGNEGEDDLLKKCYENSLKMAKENEIETISFPSISTGYFGFPVKRAARIALTTVRDFLENKKGIKEVVFVLFDQSTFDIYERALDEIAVSANSYKH